MYPNLFFDDQLWVNMIQGAEWLWWVDQTHVNDPVLLNLFWMGVLNWTGLNNCLHQATQAIWHSTSMHLWTFPCIMKLEHRVRNGCRAFLSSLTNPFLLGGWHRSWMESPQHSDQEDQGRRREEPPGSPVDHQPDWGGSFEEQLDLCWEVGVNPWLDRSSCGGTPSP